MPNPINRNTKEPPDVDGAFVMAAGKGQDAGRLQKLLIEQRERLRQRIDET